MAAIDVDKLRLSAPSAQVDRLDPRLPRHQQGEPFLKGPIPWAWLQRAGVLRGRALHVAIILWWAAGMKRRRVVSLCLTRGNDLGLNGQATRRGLRQLELAGLVKVERKPGRCLLVTLLEAALIPSA